MTEKSSCYYLFYSLIYQLHIKIDNLQIRKRRKKKCQERVCKIVFACSVCIASSDLYYV